MPCYDGREDDDNRRNYQLCTVLCGIITKHGISIIDNLDWKEVGVKKQVVLDWWELHRKEDKRRREYDSKMAKVCEQVKNQPLTIEEINARARTVVLGLRKK
jgi:hypothetical protein